MYAIIDIETSGPKFDLHKNRIIDICIIIHDGEKTVNRFSTLINPECKIERFYTELTGITNEMVANAPKFHEVAKEIVQLTEGKIFVAHNVSFDYNFIRAEFASLGYDYIREKICTLQLSRNLIPNKNSYSLGKLCDGLNIVIHNRHRAEGDATATTSLLEHLLKITPHQLPMVATNPSNFKDDINKIFNQLPTTTGIYYWLDDEQKIFHIENSKNIRSKAINFFKRNFKNGEIIKSIKSIDYIETGSEIISQLLKIIEIKKHRLSVNKNEKQGEKLYSIDIIKKEDIDFLKITPLKDSVFSIQYFPSYHLAFETMLAWIQEYDLNIEYCELSENEKETILTHTKIKQAYHDNKTTHQLKIHQIIQQYLYPYKNFAIIDKGRTVGENSFILIENYQYAGYGYFENLSTIHSLEGFKNYIVDNTQHDQINAILKKWLSKEKRMIKVLEK